MSLTIPVAARERAVLLFSLWSLACGKDKKERMDRSDKCRNRAEKKEDLGGERRESVHNIGGFII